MAFKRASRKRDRWQALSMTIIALSVTTPPCDARIRVTKRQVAIFPQPSRQRFNQGILLDLKGQQMRSGSIFDDDRHDKDPDEQDETDDPLEPFTRYPSNSPTNVPSHSQSPSRHTTQPTYKQPTKIPSPTMLPTRSRYTTQPTSNKQPTKIPSPTILPSRYTPQPTNKQPTKIPSPTITPSKAPSRSNKQPGSNHPTEIPSSQPGSNHTTEIPSSEPPSTHPTEIPSSPPTCLLEIIDGNIGEVNSADAVILRYLYEIETDPLSTASMDQEVIPDLELAMLKYLFQGAGPGCGAGDQRRMSVYSFDSKRLEGMMGMSTSPSDVVSSEGCTTKSNDANNVCKPIQGGMSIYVKGLAEEMEIEVMDEIALGMSDNKYLHAHASIKKVTFIRAGTLVNPNPTGGPPTQQPTLGEDDEAQRTNVLAVLLGAAGLSLVAGFTIARRRISLRNIRQATRDRVDEESSALSSHLSLGAELGDFERSSPHDVETIRVSNRILSDEMEVNVDLESLKSADEEGGGYLDFFDLILEGSQKNTKRKDRDVPSDGVSEISFQEI